MVLQDTSSFQRTSKENIGYGRPGATDAEIIEAAKRAQAYDFIINMPQGFQSAVGERGSASVGQRQRIGIARAFLKTLLFCSSMNRPARWIRPPSTPS